MKYILFFYITIINMQLMSSEVGEKIWSPSPLYGIVEQRAQGKLDDNYMLRQASIILSFPSRQKWMMQIDKYKYHPSYQIPGTMEMTPLDRAAQAQDKHLCLLFFQYGANPLTTSKKILDNSQEAVLMNAYSYANGTNSLEPIGWLKELWDEFESSVAKAMADASSYAEAKATADTTADK